MGKQIHNQAAANGLVFQAAPNILTKSTSLKMCLSIWGFQ